MTLTPWPVTYSLRRTGLRTARRQTRSTPAPAPPLPPPPLRAWRRWSFSPMTASLGCCRAPRSPSTLRRSWLCSRNPTLPSHHPDSPRWEVRITMGRICLIQHWSYRGTYPRRPAPWCGTAGCFPQNQRGICSPRPHVSFLMTVASQNQVLFLPYPGQCLFSATKRTNAPRALRGSHVRKSGSVSAKKSSITATARTVTSSMTWTRQNCSYTQSWVTWGSARFTAVPPPPPQLLLFLTNSCWKTVASQPATASHQQGQLLLHLVCLLTHLPSPKKQSCASRQLQRFDPGPLVMFKANRCESFIVLDFMSTFH